MIRRPPKSTLFPYTPLFRPHLKMLQSLAGKLNRLNDVREIGMTIANELRALIDYHNCRVFVVEGEDVVPIAFRGDLSAPPTGRSEEHTSELQSRSDLVCRLL